MCRVSRRAEGDRRRLDGGGVRNRKTTWPTLNVIARHWWNKQRRCRCRDGGLDREVTAGPADGIVHTAFVESFPTAALTLIVEAACICDGMGDAKRIVTTLEATMLMGVDTLEIFANAVEVEVAVTVTGIPGGTGGAT